MKRPDPGNPPQTLCVQYSNIEAFDGTTPSLPFVRALRSTNAENIIEVDQAGPLGLVDPDGGEGGSMGDRFILWLEVVVDAPTTLIGELVDGENPDIVLATVIPSQAVSEAFFRGVHFRVPQGGLLRLRTVPPVGGRLRYRPALTPDDCCDAAGGSGPPTVSAEYANIGFGWQGNAIAQTGSETDWVDIIGPGVLSAGAQGFSSPSDNAFQYDGNGGRFFARAQIGCFPTDGDPAALRLRVAVNGTGVPNSEMLLVRASTDHVALVASGQLDLVNGDVVTFQVFDDGADTAMAVNTLGAQIWRVN